MVFKYKDGWWGSGGQSSPWVTFGKMLRWGFTPPP